MKKVTIQMIAQAAGVSPGSVSRILNQSTAFQEETRLRVIATARQLGYRRVMDARKKTVGIILPDAQWIDSYFTTLMQTLQLELRRRSFHVEIITEEDIALLNERLICGGISLSLTESVESHWAELSHLPLVRLNGSVSGYDNLCSVCADGFSAARLAIDALWRHGHRRIAFFSNIPEEEERRLFSARYPGFLTEMAARGIEHPEQYGAFRENGELFPGVRRIVEQGCTAGICVNGAYSYKVLKMLKDIGLKIPMDFSLVAWEQPEISEYLDPPLSCCRIDYLNLSVEAVNALEEMLKNGYAANRRIPFQFIQRASIASAPPGEAILVREALEERILRLLLSRGELTLRELAEALSLSCRNGNLCRTLQRLRARGKIQLLYPDKPRSKHQKLLLVPSSPDTKKPFKQL